MIFVSFMPLLKLLLAATLLFFLSLDQDGATNTLPLLLISQCVLLVVFGRSWLRANGLPHAFTVRNAGEARHHIDSGELRMLGWLAGGLTMLAYLQNGMPLLSGDPNAAKVLLSDSWLLMRGLRFIVPIVIFLRCYLYFAHGESWTAQDKAMGAFFLLIALGSGYKGYVLSYLILPGIFAYSLYSPARISVVKAVVVGFVALALVVLNIAFNEGLSVADGLAFLFMRVSYAQAEGSIHIIFHPEQYAGVSPVLMNMQALLQRGLGGDEVLNFNAYVFDVIHGENPLKMQISVPFFVEGLLEAGIWGVLAILIGELLLLRAFLVAFARKTRLASLGLTFGTFLLFIDVAMNGGIFLRVIDLAISSLLLLACLVAVKFFIFACTADESSGQRTIA